MASKYKIYISIHRRDPVDFSKYRNTAIYCVPEDDSASYFYHFTGVTRGFNFEKRKNFDPTSSYTFAKKVKMDSVPVLNEDREFNCQQWVELALNTLRHAGYLKKEQYNDALDEMLEAIMEAEDEDIAQ
ncbi:hypothetical protein QQS21_003351 [Conoideocrella luteorostrata]|uniref:Uncharacterized protein n=1 Tax=Conoideocrella luteorostrata TaxID=1105319 RepID=A0AAJ0FWH9_9HYPO|nr:hypothetical protein QQS21_003351 [Conoideocrella luteorostrata]